MFLFDFSCPPLRRRRFKDASRDDTKPRDAVASRLTAVKGGGGGKPLTLFPIQLMHIYVRELPLYTNTNPGEKKTNQGLACHLE